MIPNPHARFRPRADLADLQRFKREARDAFAADLSAEIAAAGVAETITAWLEARYPQADMAVLARYGSAREDSSVSVHAHDEYFRVALARPVLTPMVRGGSYYACARRFSEEPGYGLKPDYLAKLTAEGGLEKYLADHRAREAGFLPREVDSTFDRLAAARREFKRIEQELDAFAATKDDAGRYPTWGEIEAAFPILGDFLARERQAVQVAA